MQRLFAMTVSLCAVAVLSGAGASAEPGVADKPQADSSAVKTKPSPAAGGGADEQTAGVPAGKDGSHMKGHRHGQGPGGLLSPLGYYEPKPRQVLALPSLTPDQRQKISSIYKACKDVTEPLGDKIKAIRGDLSKKAAAAAAKEEAAAAKTASPSIAGAAKSSAKAGTSAPDSQAAKPAGDDEQEPTGIGRPGKHNLVKVSPEVHAQLKALREQIHAARSKAWQDVKALLTEAQMNELNNAIDPTIHLGKRAQEKEAAEAAAKAKANGKADKPAEDKSAPAAKP